MDHYETEDERKERWYATHLTPRSIKVLPARKWEDLARQGGGDATSSSPGATVSYYDGGSVRSLPYEWLSRDPSGMGGERVQGLMRASIEEHGLLVISNVLSEGDCAVALEMAWDWLEGASFAERRTTETTSSSCGNHLAGADTDGAFSNDQALVDRNDRRSLRRNFPKAVEGGIQPFYGSGHSTLAWFVRGHPHVRHVFSSLYNASQDLLASLDGIILWPNRNDEGGGGSNDDVVGMKGKEISDAGWFHIDQNPRHRPGREGVQGLVNLLPVSRATGGNTLVAQSHRLFPAHYTTRNSHNASTFYEQRLDEVGTDDWLEIDPTDAVLLEPSRILMLELAHGDVLLWDSRTVHCSYPPDREFAAKAGSTAPMDYGLLRAATLVNMVPTESVASRAATIARREASVHMRTLTHWVNKAAPLGNERSDQVALEERRVAAILEWQAHRGKKVLLSWDDLSADQRALVVGNDDTHPLRIHAAASNIMIE